MKKQNDGPVVITKPDARKYYPSQSSMDAEKDETFEEIEVYRNPIDRKSDRMVYTFDKVRVLRPRVRVTMDQALVLNHGKFIEDSNTRIKLLVIPGAPVPYVQRWKTSPTTYGEAEVVYPK